MMILNDISVSVQEGNARRTEELVLKALRDQYSPVDILREGVAAGIIEARQKFQRGEILDSEVLISEWAMKAALGILMPVVTAGENPALGTVVTGTLEGDIREAEKDIIVCLMRSKGLAVVDLGTSVSAARFVEAAIAERADVIACNTALTVFMPQMKLLVQTALQADIRGKTKILLSGVPVSGCFCKSIDADMYAANPIQAAEIAAEHCRKLSGK